jgi:hypothetical protein
MMNGSGKSDSVIVAKKPANNAEPSAAEPRAEIKGNANQQSTHRTQSSGKRDPGAGTRTESSKQK